jgi:superfamily I DNA/RNA helicase
VPRLYPQEPEFADERVAERVAWERLRDSLPEEAALFHSVALVERDHECEIDLLVLWPGVGVAAIEVKGGSVSRTDQGWLQSGRKIGNPVAQAQDGVHVLTRFLAVQAPSTRGARAAHLIALPFTTVPPGWTAPDCGRDMVLDKHDLASAADLVRAAIEHHGAGHQPLSQLAADAAITALAGTLISQTSLLSDADEHEQRAFHMTHLQYKTLNAFQYQRRFCVIGGAGTGKTWLAIEQARRLAKAGDRVALLCYSRGLARLLERETAKWPAQQRPAFVGLFHQLPVQWGAEPPTEDSGDFEERLPRQLGELAAGRSDLFDAIVVDEAQDFGDLWWTSVLACLKDPVGGKLYAFMDQAQRVFSREGEVPIDLPPYPLEENIRNTKRIAQLFSSLSGETLKPRGLEGAPVRLVESPIEDVIGRADDAIDALLEEGWEPGQIALLTTQHRHPEQKNAVDLGGHTAYWDSFFAAEDVFYGHVLGFKGLERSVVVLAVNGFKQVERAREMLYVGLSRAQSVLVLVGPRDLLEQVGGAGVISRLKKAEQWNVPSS